MHPDPLFRFRVSSLAAVLVVTTALCLPVGLVHAQTRADSDPLMVFAAASLKNAMDSVVDAYEDNQGGRVVVNYAGSSTLARQIEQGAPAEIYVSANQDWMDRLASNDLVDTASRVDLLANALVLVAPTDSDISLSIAPDFAIVTTLGDEYLAMANVDAVPAGIYGRQALTALGVWQALQGHVAQADDVRATLALVARGETPLGVVYASDAVAEQDVRVVDTFPADSHDPIIYPAAIVHGVDDPQARPFMAFLQTEQAAAIFRKWGFRSADGRSETLPESKS